ncbi:DUF4192 family protein [Cellulomonas sp. DKR-3]|uniref:DUF4192 family protein n=1 Tax=Cellulomonas fulva TaxID=2835530 RepID=A0ABS5U0K0_9CELL|nr:DUF4192 domain-containing protein [Cellulomonas fulva]MBT0994881.1 DUF4192 family protein [Cellulomonas fulva]
MTTTTLRVHEPREIISLVPYRLGFRPRDSVVAVSLRAPRGRVGVVMRVDLDAMGDPVLGSQVARAVVGTLGKDRATSSVLVVYTDDDPRGRPGPVERAVHHYREASDALLGPAAVWVVTASGYLSFDCARPCCPPGGRPLRELDSTQVAARMVLAGTAVAESRDALVRFALADPDRRRVVARSRRRWERRGAEALVRGPAAVEEWRAASLAAWRTAVSVAAGTAPTGGHAPWGRVEAGLRDRRVRDAVLATLVPGVGDLPERSLRGRRTPADVDAEMGRVTARIMGSADGRPPVLEATRTHEAALEGVVVHGLRDRQAPALTLLGLLAWWRGDGARASVLLARALGDDPEYRLAALLDAALTAGLAPGWARTEERGTDGAR